jgi:chitin-binding protein
MLMQHRKTVLAAALGLPFLLVGLASSAQAHGTPSFPASRSFQCRFNESPENPRSEACKAVKAAAGSSPQYDWNEVNIPNAAGRLAEIIPDGQLCSAGRDKYRGLNLARADWPKTDIQTARSVTLRYFASAAHRPSYFDVYVTREGYDPTQPLRFADLERVARLDDPPLLGDTYQLEVTLPRRAPGTPGIVYVHWQRKRPASDEAFYSCSDVTFR